MNRILAWLGGVWRSTASLVAIALIITAFFLGWSLGGGGEVPTDRAVTQPGGAPPAGPVEYTCSMHPQVRLTDPDAKCPICFMDLIPVTTGEGAAEDERLLVMTPAARKLAEIETTPVVRRYPTHTVPMYGYLDHDETRIATIAAYFPGRLERMFVDYTGIPVREGDHLVEIYSPELVTTESDLVRQRRNLDRMRDTAAEETLRSFEATIEGTREKLRLWGLTAEQIRQIEETGATPDHLTIYSPMGGIVIEKHKVKGDYVQTGEAIFSVADLSHLWLRLDAYESDLRWIRHGQTVEFTTEAYPGETFAGMISFIDPQVSAATRTSRLRVNVDNAHGRLKPGMFVRATVRPRIGGGGEVIIEDLAGQWICPMHPEVVADTQTPCDLCGMDLVPAEDLGYVLPRSDAPPPLVIPKSAPLITGRRAVVYVELPDRDRPTFEAREIVLGPRAGDVYIVREDAPGGANLREGERVVANGAFKIDSALQILAKPSMMAPPDDGATTAPGDDTSVAPPDRVDVPSAFLDDVAATYAAYFDVQEALAADDVAGFKRGAAALHAAVAEVESEGLEADVRAEWRLFGDRLRAGAERVDALEGIADARLLFYGWSSAIIDLERSIGHAGTTTHFVIFCPMAFDNRGASWLARVEEVRNPYFGASMLRCGTVKSRFAARDHVDEAEDAR